MNPTTMMPGAATSVYDNIPAAQGMRGGIYFSPIKGETDADGKINWIPANYRVVIHRCKHDKDRKGVEMFICETEILQSDNPALPVGAMPGVVIKFDKDAALGNVKDIVAAALASKECVSGNFVTPETVSGMINGALMTKVNGPENILVGAECQLHAFNRPTREGRDFTRIAWSVPTDIAQAAKTKVA